MKLAENICDSNCQEIELLIEEFNSRGGMSTEELITRLNAVPFDEFQEGLREKIQNYERRIPK